MRIGQNHDDNCLLIKTERPATCASCGRVIPTGERAWSYLPNPTHGNYVEHFDCRYGPSPTCYALDRAKETPAPSYVRERAEMQARIMRDLKR